MIMQMFNKDKFNVKKEFFIIDSNNLEKVKDKLYGYSVNNGQVIINGNVNKEKVLSEGAFVSISNTNENLIIKQDYLGSYGIYIYRQNDYFAISNSLLYLVEYVKKNHSITINKDYINAFLSQDIYSLSYKETIINEIQILERNAYLIIDKNNKILKTEYIDYKENTVKVDSPEFFQILDEWFFKWTGFIRELKTKTNNLVVDLSGGMDSRIVFILFLGAQINLNEVVVNVFKDKLHTHKEDYEIAEEIANHYHFQLNNREMCMEKSVPFSLKDATNICQYLKLSLHKQFYPRPCKYERPFFLFGGQGGECIRHYWNMDESGFIHKNQKYFFDNNLEPEMNESVRKVITNTCDCIRENPKRFNREFDESYLTVNIFRETYCRQHFGKVAIGQFFTNQFCFFPTLDISLNKLKLSNDCCTDKNLLIAIIFTRYIKDILNFKFDSNRSINEDTIQYAKMLNAKYPLEPRYKNLISYQGDEVHSAITNVACKSDVLLNKMNNFYLKRYNTAKTKAIFNTYFNQRIYDSIMDDVRSRQRFPLQNFYPIIAISRFTWATFNKGGRKINNKFYQTFIKNYIKELLQEALKQLQYTFSIKNQKSGIKIYKVITLFGIKFKFRNFKREHL